MQPNIWIYIAVMAVVTYLIRVLPLVFVRRQIRSPLLRSFLYYVPYVTLSVMTFPAILDATHSPIAGLAALMAGILLAYFKCSLLQVSLACCGIVLILEFFL